MPLTFIHGRLPGNAVIDLKLWTEYCLTMRAVATVSTLSYQTVQLITEKLTCLGPEVSHVDNIRNSSERITSDRVAWWPFDHIFFPILSFRDREDRRPDPRGTLSACFSGFPSRESSSASSTTSHDLTTLFPCWNRVVSCYFPCNL